MKPLYANCCLIIVVLGLLALFVAVGIAIWCSVVIVAHWREAHTELHKQGEDEKQIGGKGFGISSGAYLWEL